MKTSSQPKTGQYHDPELFWKSFIIQGLSEDSSVWDWTTRAVSKDETRPSKARLVAKGPGIWVGDGLVSALRVLAKEAGAPVTIQSKVSDGESFKKGQTLCAFKGPAQWLLRVERPLINVAAFASGIAFQTHELVSQVKKQARSSKLKLVPRVTLTRKTLPHYRDLSIASVIAGGGSPHRTQLSAGVLLKENHIAKAGSVAKAIAQARKTAPHTLKIEIEVKNERELKAALDNKADIVLLDNFSPKEVQNAVKIIEKSKSRPLVEVSGGIGAENIASYVQRGVDIISCGCITHSVKSADLSLLFESI